MKKRDGEQKGSSDRKWSERRRKGALICSRFQTADGLEAGGESGGRVETAEGSRRTDSCRGSWRQIGNTLKTSVGPEETHSSGNTGMSSSSQWHSWLLFSKIHELDLELECWRPACQQSAFLLGFSRLCSLPPSALLFYAFPQLASDPDTPQRRPSSARLLHLISCSTKAGFSSPPSPVCWQVHVIEQVLGSQKVLGLRLWIFIASSVSAVDSKG